MLWERRERKPEAGLRDFLLGRPSPEKKTAIRKSERDSPFTNKKERKRNHFRKGVRGFRQRGAEKSLG